jgi:hypothetical protein
MWRSVFLDCKPKLAKIENVSLVLPWGEWWKWRVKHRPFNSLCTNPSRMRHSSLLSATCNIIFLFLSFYQLSYFIPFTNAIWLLPNVNTHFSTVYQYPFDWCSLKDWNWSSNSICDLDIWCFLKCSLIHSTDVRHPNWVSGSETSLNTPWRGV